MTIDVRRHLEEYTIALEAGQKLEISVDGSIVYTNIIPPGMLALVDFRATESKIESE